jgi:hypothetical protein
MAHISGRDDLVAGQRPAVSPPRLIYLGGLGRSGSTIIERLLGELPGICSVGEVVHLWRRGIADSERCGCGEPFPECPFWRKVGEVAFGGWGQVDVGAVHNLRDKIDRTRFVPVLARSRLSPAHRRTVDGYLSYYLRVYAAVAEVSGCQAIVDSSKHASLAFCLRWCEGIDLRVIHIVRDPRAVAYSWARQVSRPDVSGQAVPGDSHMWTYSSPTAAMQWNLQNGAMQLLARKGTPTLLVRYEDFVRAPGALLGEMAAFAGLPAAADVTGFLGGDGADRWADLSVSHTVSGNPVRFATGRIPIRQDERWRAAMPAAQRRAVTALTLPLLAHYGYPRGKA